jgi:hypothetical protein
MMHGHEKSRLAIVAVKPANKLASSTAEQSAEELAAAESRDFRQVRPRHLGSPRFHSHRAQARLRIRRNRIH